MKILINQNDKTIESKPLKQFAFELGESDDNPKGSDKIIIGITKDSSILPLLTEESELYFYNNILYLVSPHS